MTTHFIFLFLGAMTLSLLLTPLAGRLGRRWGGMDVPDQRKVHSTAIPRTGGLAIFVSFYACLLAAIWLHPPIGRMFKWNYAMTMLVSGHLLVFGVGLLDDFRRLSPWVKFGVQIVAASLAYFSGLSVQFFSLPPDLFHHVLNYAMTVFWFVLLINAVNLIDGLDGLAAGVVFFASLTMTVLSVLSGKPPSAVLFVCLAGSTFGFLRYNFNPASIFMGDGGSYFLGYALAAISLLGAVKSQTWVAMIIPLIALGLPLFDTLLSPVRRFVRGKAMFKPDSGHLHHRLLAMGMTTRRAVLFCYLATVVLGVASVIIVHMRNEQAALMLLVLGLVAAAMVRKLGYFEYITSEKVLGWFRDVTDEAGFSRERRSFLDIQVAIGKSVDLPMLWEHVGQALAKMSIDHGTLHVVGCPEMTWSRQEFDAQKICASCLMRVDLPLLGPGGRPEYGHLTLVKDLRRECISHYTLRRIEHLRRSISEALARLRDGRTVE
jgi:UDP-GlcNAc:undecaprenyl-phosphate/decaprenyl-phosphate GlcNAc-1-phosphate transferase